MNAFNNLLFMVAISIYILIFILINRIKDKYIVALIIITSIAIPGFEVGGILVNFCDFAIIILFLKVIINKRNCRELLANDEIMRWMIFYIISIGISILTSMIRINDFQIDVILKYVRLLLIVISYCIIKISFNKKDIDYYIKIILISGIVCATLGIIFFIIQSDTFNPPQTMQIGSKVMYRAGGIFKEAGTFGNMMSINIIISIIIFTSKAFKYNKIAVVNIILSFIGLIISYTRISFLSVSICLILIFISLKKINIKNTIYIIIILGSFIMIFKDTNFFHTFFEERVKSMFFINSYNINEISSGRIDIWGNLINSFISNPIIIPFGSGYKINDTQIGIISMSDNNYISALIQTGILGFVVLFLLNLKIINILIIKRVKNNKYESIRLICLFLWINTMIHMLTCDAFTFYRNMILIFTIIAIQNCYYKYEMNCR